jgi:uncharacterized membrane protein
MADSVWPVLLVALCLGGLTGLRAFTPITVLVWSLHLHHLRILGSPLYFLHNMTAIIILTILAAGELIADKLPFTPSRLRLPGLVGRVIFGAVWGASWQTSAAAGLIGALMGAIIGYEIRKGWVKTLHWHDLPVALLEDVVAIGGSILVLSRAVLLSYK